jgi:oligopeptidase A
MTYDATSKTTNTAPIRVDSANSNAASNPLLDFTDLPRFEAIKPEHASAALDLLLADAQAALERVAADKTPPGWDNLVEALESPIEHLGRAWGAVGHLNSVADSPEMREAYSGNLQRMSQFWTSLGQHQGLYLKYRTLRESDAYAGLSPTRQRVIDNALRSFKLAGAALTPDKRERFAKIQEEQAALAQRFSENALDSTNAFELLVPNESELAGLPADVIEAAAQSAKESDKTGHRFTLQFPSYFPVVKYAESARLRREMALAYSTKASMNALAPNDIESKKKLDNTGVIDALLLLRQEEASLLEYASFAEVSLVPKMAESPQQVMDFLRDLAKRAKPFALKDIATLEQFAQDKLGMQTVEASDRTYVSEKLKEERYSFSDEEVKQYFQLPKVLEGLFGLIEKLYSVKISTDQTSVWDPGVQFFRIEKGATGSAQGSLVGQFYLDLFARANKRSGAWMNDCRGRRVTAQKLQTPVAYLVCNFMNPSQGRPALLTHDEVITLFHEFGHGLHHMLTGVDELSVAGISGVEWDAVELPSQFMENFCWEWDILQNMTSHIDSAKPLPRALFDKMLAAKNFQSGLQTLRQVEFSLLDMRLHSEAIFAIDAFTSSAQAEGEAVQSIINEVRAEISVTFTPPENRMQNSFSHIFAGGYAAGYYSYKWAEVLSADAYAAFEEALAQPNAQHEVAKTGRRFLEEILAVGGSRPAIDSFRAFRGRAPNLDALLRHNGMTEEV